MAKKQVEKTEELETNTDGSVSVNLTPKLDQTGYSLIQMENGEFKAVKFRFNSETKTLGTLEVLQQGGQFDAADELILTMEEDIYQ